MNICRGLSGLVGKIDEKGLLAFEDRKITLRVSADEVGMTLSLTADELRRVLEMEGK